MRVLSLFMFFSILFFSCQQDKPTQTPTDTADAVPATKTFTLKKGDLLFQDIDCGPLCDAIETVTRGHNGAHLSHVGIVDKGPAGGMIVVEAIDKSVQQTSLENFMLRSITPDGKPKVMVGRLKDKYRGLIAPALDEVDKLLGSPYDDAFNMLNDSYYCSELIYYAFKKANNGQPIFQLRPMTYKDPKTGKTFEPWVSYFAKLDIPIPEGQPGLNPGGISRSPYLDIVYIYGQPEGFK